MPPEQVDRYAREYWSIEYPYYFNDELLQRVEELRNEGVKIFCITGGLDVYMTPLFELFPVDGYMCTRTRYDDSTYRIVGEACKNQEKINRLREYFDGDNFHVVEAYSDDKEEVLELADQAYVVKEGKVEALSN